MLLKINKIDWYVQDKVESQFFKNLDFGRFVSFKNQKLYRVVQFYCSYEYKINLFIWIKAHTSQYKISFPRCSFVSIP